jgi:hypothetical protein
VQISRSSRQIGSLFGRCASTSLERDAEGHP